MTSSSKSSDTIGVRHSSLVRRAVRSYRYMLGTCLGIAAVTACHSLDPVQSYEGFFFPRQLEVNEVMEAVIFGNLELVGHCLAVRYVVEEQALVVVWPADYDYTIADGSVQVLDGSGSQAVREGDEVYLSGGVIQSLDGIPNAIGDEMRLELQARCPGIYWFVGSEARVATEDDAL